MDIDPVAVEGGELNELVDVSDATAKAGARLGAAPQRERGGVYHHTHFGGPAIGSRESRRLRSDVANLTRGQAQHALLVDSGAAHELRIFEELEQRRDISHLKSHCPWLIISNASTVDGAGQSP